MVLDDTLCVLHAVLRLIGGAWTPRAVETGIQGLLVYLAERHARRVQEGLPSVLHCLLFRRQGFTRVVHFTHRYDSVDHRSLGAMPLVVLSPENSWNTDTPPPPGSAELT